MGPTEMTLLVCGIVLFVFALGLIVYLARKERPFGAANVLLAIAIVMIGFPLITTVRLPGVDIETIQQASTDLRNHPDDATVANKYRQQLRDLDASLAGNKNQALPADVAKELKSTVQDLKSRPKISPEARIAEAHAELLLGNTKDAATSLDAALKAKPALQASIDPKLMALAQTDLLKWLDNRRAQVEPAPAPAH